VNPARRRETLSWLGLVLPVVLSRENRVGIAFVALALLSAYAALQFDAPSWAVSAILLGVGIVCPLLLNDYLDGRAGPGAD